VNLIQVCVPSSPRIRPVGQAGEGLWGRDVRLSARHCRRPRRCPSDPGCRRGFRIGSAEDGAVRYFIPRPNPKDDQAGAEGVTADGAGNVFGAENVGKGRWKYAKK